MESIPVRADAKLDSGTMFVRPPKIEQPIDVIVPTHNSIDVDFDKGLGMTIKCMRALYTHTLAPFNLIIVDDSDDKVTPLYFRELKKRRNNITFIHSWEPYKCGNQILNIGLKHCKTPYVAHMGNSVTVEPEWEIAALRLFEEDPKIGLIGFKCLFPNDAIGVRGGSIESGGISFINYTPVDIARDLTSHRQTAIYEVPAVQWAFAMFRKEAAIGNLAENIYHGFKGWDDIDNSMVFRHKGWKVIYCGYGVGYHHPRATRGRGPEDQETHIQNRDNARRFYKRWGYWDAFVKDYPGDWPEAKEGAVPMPD